MKHSLAERTRLVAVFTAVTLACAIAIAQDPAPLSDDMMAVALIEAHNVERAKEKLPPLKLAPLLAVAAQGHAKDMADRDSMSHDGSDGSTPSQRIVRAGYHYQTAGENVAKGYDGVPGVMQGWMDSPPHRKNVLGDFTEIGVARAYTKEGKPYWCADFGKPIPKFEPGEAAIDLLKRINAERTAAKLSILEVDDRLAKVAGEQASVLAKTKGPDRASLSFAGINQSQYRELAMTTAVGQPDAQAVLKMFLESEGHKAQLLGKFSKIGIGYATAEDGQPSWCVILGLPTTNR